ncbi:chemotaxis protein [Pseudanabaena sp. ABRG5-3]|nr:chemotaxis protein [Pseudanabaena sp. ABRG5-3]
MPPNNRYIMAKVGDRTVTFPDVLVSEIMIVERNAILALPFYENVIVGVIHHQATVMPLLLLRLLIGEQRTLISESLTVVRLSKVADELSDQKLEGVGIIVDRVVGSLESHEYQPSNDYSDYQNLELDSADQMNLGKSDSIVTKKINQTVANIKENEYTPIEIILSSIHTHIWQPQRWGKYSVG